MSDIIRLLPDSVANQIAAGEVIQRPASVVKELVENAIDAGATAVEVIIRDAGRTLIQVVDNGCGMTETDARMAFERHATSKIQQADDLFSLHTMGFRGEALASICAVAQVELRTRTADSEVGCRLVINGSRVETQEPAACAKGSNMMVKNLFFNVPARRKFLKKDAVEFSNISREFERMALVNPGVDLTLVHNDTIVHNLLRGSFKQRISDLFGKSVERQLVPVATSTSIVKIDGFVGLPDHARRRNALQYLTVNGRHMRHPYFHKAIMQVYEPLIPADQQPNYFLNFTVDPATIDVNIHPTKNEIKFENEAPIWQILTAAVRESLGRFNAMPSIDFDTDDSIDIPVFNPNADGDHDVKIDTTYNPFDQPAFDPGFSSAPPRSSGGAAGTPSMRTTGMADDWQKLYEGFMGGAPSQERHIDLPADASSFVESEITLPLPDELADTPDAALLASPDSEPPTSIQIGCRYLLTPAKSGLMVIDQHRAHVKVLFERFRTTLLSGSIGVQQVLFPEVLRLSAAQSDLLQSIQERIHEMGFELSFLGDNAWAVSAVPAMTGDTNPSEIILNIIEDAASDIDAGTAVIAERVALSMARSAAITAGRALSAEERNRLIGDLLQLPSPNFTPDGLPIIKMLSDEDLSRLF